MSYILYQLLESELPKDVCQTKTNPEYLQLDERIHALEFFNHNAGVSSGLFSQL